MTNKQNYLLESDENLISLFSASKDKMALEELFKRHMTSAYYLALKYMRNQADAEDVVQKAFINIMRFAEHQNQQGKVRAWIMKTVINTSKNEIQSLVTHRKHIQKKSVQQNIVTSDGNTDAEELRKTLVTAIENLPEHFRLPIWLTHYEDMSIKEVADCLGRPEKTIRTQIARGLEKLEQALKGQLSKINAMSIVAILAECKLNDKPPITLAEKINSISSMKISSRMMPREISQKSFWITYYLPISCAFLLGFICFYWWQNKSNHASNDKSVNHVNIQNVVLDNTKKVESDILNYFTDFNSKQFPAWCLLDVGESNFFNDNDSHAEYIKSDKTNKLWIQLKIPTQHEPFIVSYDLKPHEVVGELPSLTTIGGANKAELITFCYDVPLNPNIWNHIDLIAQDNIESMWVNGQLKMVVVSSEKYQNHCKIALRGFIAKIDNIGIKKLELNKLPELSEFIELSKQFKDMKKPFESIGPSPVKHKFPMVKVYSGRGENDFK